MPRASRSSPNPDSPLGLLAIPTEILRHIAFWLAPGDAARLARTCRTLFEAIDGAREEVWRDARAAHRWDGRSILERLLDGSSREAVRLREIGAPHRGPCTWARCRVPASEARAAADGTFPASLCRVADHWMEFDPCEASSKRPEGRESERMGVEAYRAAMRSGRSGTALALRRRGPSLRLAPYVPPRDGRGSAPSSSDLRRAHEAIFLGLSSPLPPAPRAPPASAHSIWS